MTPTQNSPLPAAEICRRNDWEPGARLVGDEGYGPTVIEITAVGVETILARCISHNGTPCCGAGEQMWHLDCRDWRETSE